MTTKFLDNDTQEVPLEILGQNSTGSPKRSLIFRQIVSETSVKVSANFHKKESVFRFGTNLLLNQDQSLPKQKRRRKKNRLLKTVSKLKIKNGFLKEDPGAKAAGRAKKPDEAPPKSVTITT